MRLTKGFSLVLAILALAACSPTFQEGEYLSFENTLITFHADGQFTVQNPVDFYIVENGSYSVEEDVVTIVDELCGKDIECGYNWSVDTDGALQLDIIDEECLERGPLRFGLTQVRL